MQGCCQLGGVHRVDDGHTGDRSHYREVVVALVAGAEGRRNARKKSSDNGSVVACRKCHLDLVARPAGGEDAICDRHWQKARLGEAACDAHHVLLGHSDLEETFRERGGKRGDVSVLR